MRIGLSAPNGGLVLGLLELDFKVASLVALALDNVEPKHLVHLVDALQQLPELRRLADVAVLAKLVCQLRAGLAKGKGVGPKNAPCRAQQSSIPRQGHLPLSPPCGRHLVRFGKMLVRLLALLWAAAILLGGKGAEGLGAAVARRPSLAARGTGCWQLVQRPLQSHGAVGRQRPRALSAVLDAEADGGNIVLEQGGAFGATAAAAAAAVAADGRSGDGRVLDDGAKDRTLSFGGFASRLSDIVTKSKLWGLYSVSLTLRPVYTKALSSMLGFLIGDFLVQTFYVKRAFDVARFLRMGAFGALVHAPLGHAFYGFLERRFPGVNVSALATKLAIDQIVWTPLLGSLLFSFIGITAGHSPSAIFRTIKNNLLKVVLTSWVIWPVAHAVNFKYITPKHRLLYINAVQVLYNAFLSAFAAR